jgi:hypothetical protein
LLRNATSFRFYQNGWNFYRLFMSGSMILVIGMKYSVSINTENNFFRKKKNMFQYSNHQSLVLLSIALPTLLTISISYTYFIFNEATNHCVFCFDSFNYKLFHSVTNYSSKQWFTIKLYPGDSLNKKRLILCSRLQSCLKVSSGGKLLFVILIKLDGRYSLGSTLYL